MMPRSTPPVVSFTVRRPTPTSRNSSSGPESDGPFKIPALPRHLASAGISATGSSPLARSPRTLRSREETDSDDDKGTGIVFPQDVPGADDSSQHADSSDEDALVGRDEQRQQRFHSKKKRVSDEEAVLVIPTQPNPDWREAARRRRAACSRTQPFHSRATPSFVPDSALATTGADGSVGGLGTKGVINSGPQLSGLHVHKRVKMENDEDDTVEVKSVDTSPIQAVEETEDQKALRAILAGEDESASVVEIIPVPPLSEADALKQDIQELPDVATANDYERVPISAFGAAMLRGMGWTGGAVAPKSDKRSKNALAEPYLPQARPTLLGIGAKEREPDDDGSGKKKPKGRDMRYVPVIREGSDRGEHGSSRSGTVSRRSSRSPSRREREPDRAGDRERSTYDNRERKRDQDRWRNDESRSRTREYDGKDRERNDRSGKDRDREVERDRGRSRGDDSSRGRGKEGEARRYDDKRDRTRERDRRDR